MLSPTITPICGYQSMHVGEQRGENHGESIRNIRTDQRIECTPAHLIRDSTVSIY
jgi:hypothetical protein